MGIGEIGKPEQIGAVVFGDQGGDQDMNYLYIRTKVNDRMWKDKRGVKDEFTVSGLGNRVDDRVNN